MRLTWLGTFQILYIKRNSMLTSDREQYLKRKSLHKCSKSIKYSLVLGELTPQVNIKKSENCKQCCNQNCPFVHLKIKKNFEDFVMENLFILLFWNM